MGSEEVLRWLGVCVVAAPAGLLAVLGVIVIFQVRLSERLLSRVLQFGITLALLAAGGVLALMLYTDRIHVPIELVKWVVAGGYHFDLKIVFDRLSTAFVILSLALSAVVGAFTTSYLHREPGFQRYFLLYALFVLGMVTASLAATIETLFAGWEMVGLSSALLIGFFQERPAPVRSGLWVWAIYRVADAALLLAAIVLHHRGSGDFERLLGEEPWPLGKANMGSGAALVVGLLLVVAAAGKSGLVPFSGWLPRAMEGPTTSTAVFYGALSVHLGAYLLLRMSAVLDASIWLSAVVVVLGLVTALLASLSGGVQTDVKSALAYASLAQVGIIVAEIGLGFRWLPLVHIIGHACLRTLQFLRAPSFLRDHQRLENAVGGRLSAPERPLLPEGARAWLYRLGLERGWLDLLLWEWVAGPFVALFEALNALDRWWASVLGGTRDEGHREGRP
jgi:NAD(P)H-quinone oxidoreductase subunit 5